MLPVTVDIMEERTEAVSGSDPSRLSSLVTEQGGVGSDITEDGGVTSINGLSMELTLGVGRTAGNLRERGCGRLAGSGKDLRSLGRLERVNSTGEPAPEIG